MAVEVSQATLAGTASVPCSEHTRVFGVPAGLPVGTSHPSTLGLAVDPFAGIQPGLKPTPRGALLEQVTVIVGQVGVVAAAPTVDGLATKSTTTAKRASLNMLSLVERIRGWDLVDELSMYNSLENEGTGTDESSRLCVLLKKAEYEEIGYGIWIPKTIEGAR